MDNDAEILMGEVKADLKERIDASTLEDLILFRKMIGLLPEAAFMATGETLEEIEGDKALKPPKGWPNFYDGTPPDPNSGWTKFD